MPSARAQRFAEVRTHSEPYPSTQAASFVAELYPAGALEHAAAARRRRRCGGLVSPPRDAAAALWLVQCRFTDACRIEAKLGALRPEDD